MSTPTVIALFYAAPLAVVLLVVIAVQLATPDDWEPHWHAVPLFPQDPAQVRAAAAAVHREIEAVHRELVPIGQPR